VRGRVKQKLGSIDQRVVMNQMSNGDVLDVAGQLGGESMEWSSNWVDRLTGAA
jgi:hypothetical protein